MTARLLVAAVLLSGCAARPPARPPSPEAYADRGPLAVRGAPASAPGPTIVRSLRTDPRAGATLAARGDPETIEIVTRPGREKQVVLAYPAGRDGRPRRVVVDLGGRRDAARRPARPVRAASTRRSAAPEPVHAPPAAGGTPTAQQSLECPIDPERAECRALCGERNSYEWCR
jgi:hypothetical protein